MYSEIKVLTLECKMIYPSFEHIRRRYPDGSLLHEVPGQERNKRP